MTTPAPASKTLKPVLTGQRLKTRKRDEKKNAKFSPEDFFNELVEGINGIPVSEDPDKTCAEIEAWLDKAGSRMDYQRYPQALFDALVYGKLLDASGNEVPQETSMTNYVLLNDSDDHFARWIKVLDKLMMKRYKFLMSGFSDHMQRMMKFLKGYAPDLVGKLAVFYGHCYAKEFAPVATLGALNNDYMVREGISLSFATQTLQSWQRQTTVASFLQQVKKNALDTLMLQLFPEAQRKPEIVEEHYRAHGLDAFNKMQASKLLAKSKHKFAATITDHCTKRIEPNLAKAEQAKIDQEILRLIEKNQTGPAPFSREECIQLVWNAIMDAESWKNKKSDTLQEQSMRHILGFAGLLDLMTADSSLDQLHLMNAIQAFCYENMNFINLFDKIIKMLYNKDVIEEDVILKWFKDGHLSKGTTVLLSQMQPFITWLQNAEEESSSEDEE